MEAEERASKTLHHFPRLHPPASSICLQYDGFGANHPGFSGLFLGLQIPHAPHTLPCCTWGALEARRWIGAVTTPVFWDNRSHEPFWETHRKQTCLQQN